VNDPSVLVMPSFLRAALMDARRGDVRKQWIADREQNMLLGICVQGSGYGRPVAGLGYRHHPWSHGCAMARARPMLQGLRMQCLFLYCGVRAASCAGAKNGSTMSREGEMDDAMERQTW